MVGNGKRSGGTLLSVEAARGIAAVIVVLYHAARHLDKDVGFPLGKQAFQFGHAGVDFFFVISGFVIMYVHGGDLGRPDRLTHYALRRFTRIYPIYWVILGLTIVLMLLSSHPLWPSAIDVLWDAALLPTRLDPIVGVAWTLQHELIFYAVFAVLILHLRAGLALLALWFAVIACGLVMGLMILPTTFASAYNLEFFFGMAIALRLRRGVVPCARPILLTGLAAFALACAAEVFGAIDGYQPWARFAYGVPSGLIILGLVALERNGDVLVPAPLQWLGRGSYSIYLFHLTVIGVTYKLWSLAGMEKWAPLWLSLGLIAAAGVGGGVIISRTVEYPLMRWIRHRLRRIDGP